MRGPRNPYRYSDHYVQRPGNPRYQSSPMTSQGHGLAGPPLHGYTQSYDTVETGGSYATSTSEPWANSTDPSSENSSIERAHNMSGHKPEYGDHYGGQHRRDSPRHDPIQEEYGFDGNGYTQGQWHGPSSPPPPPPPPRHSGQYGPPRPTNFSAAPPPPRHQQDRNVIPLNASNSAAPIVPEHRALPPTPQPQPQQRQLLRKESNTGEGKRKSWLRRRFSKG